MSHPMRKVFMMPTVAQADQDDTNSIHQIVKELANALPQFGWEVVHSPQNADIIAAHAGQTYNDLPCDVAHCHGLYPTGLFQDDPTHWAINRRVIESLQTARLITVPSKWVADVVARELQRPSKIVPWAVHSDEWVPKPVEGHSGMTLWNKTRADSVCDPTPVAKLAEAIPSARFISTYTTKAMENIEVTGRISYNKMKALVPQAALYLATTKETFGIGVLEAMSCGIPILGFNWGAVPEYVQHGVSGFLAEPGDWQGLIDGWHYCMSHREVLGANARQVAMKYTWEETARQMAKVYDEAWYMKTLGDACEVSVVIPCHNYGEYLSQAIVSSVMQIADFQFEVIVVDDASSDNTPDIVKKHQKERQFGQPSLEYIRIDKNVHVAEARNQGIKAARGKFIVCLDADDRLGSPGFLQLLRDHLKDNPKVGIAYTGLGTFEKSEEDKVVKQPWPRESSVSEQFMGHNQIPTCCMFRSRMFLLGYTAKQVTSDPIFNYRVHPNSLSRKAPAVDWLRFHPWKNINRYPAGCSVVGTKHSWPVFNYDRPAISIIIPVGPGHSRHVMQALDSVFAQTFTNWECIVLNNSGVSLEVYPWVRVIECPEVKMRASIVRNIGISAASAPLISFLDADDFMYPEFLAKTLIEHRRTGKYVYTDWVSKTKQGNTEVGRTREYSTWNVFNKDIIHTINILIPKKWLQQVGGFDETMHTWEDVDLWMKLASKGFCGTRLAEALICYDYNSGTLREQGMEISETVLKPLFRDRYGKYMGEGAEVCNCITAPTKNGLSLEEAASNGEGQIRVEYKGATAKVTVIGAVTKQNYGRRAYGDIFWMWESDQLANVSIYQPMPEQKVFMEDTQIPLAPVPL
jgi:glycosyltransferase involved in cell wall biosynthesis